jgi:hypothetical protein
MTNSVAAVTRQASGRKPGHMRRNTSVAAGSCARITDRKRLTDLWKWVTRLHDERGWSFREIAKHTTRGPGSHGYWQSVYTRAHLDKRPRIRPCVYDWHDLKMIDSVSSKYADVEGALLNALLRFDTKHSELSAECVALVQLVQRLVHNDKERV